MTVPRLNFNSYLENKDYYPALKEENLFEKPAETSRLSFRDMLLVFILCQNDSSWAE